MRQFRRETIAIHGGFSHDPATKSVAVPIYQTVAYEFDSADHGAALFNLEAEGFSYSRIGNPTNAVLEHRVAELEGGIDALSVASGQAAMLLRDRKCRRPWRQYRLRAAALRHDPHPARPFLPRQGVEARFAQSERPRDIASAIDCRHSGGFLRKCRKPGRQHLRY